MLSKEDFYSFKVPPVKAEVPEIGGEVYLRCMTGAERDSYEEGFIDSKGNFRAKLLVRCICDAEGHRLFNDNEAGELGEVPAHILNSLFEMAADLNGISDASAKELEKNSGAIQSDASTSS